MKYVYPAIFRPEPEGGFHVFFPDIEGAGTCGNDLKDCMEMGADWLCLKLYDLEQKNSPIPKPSDINEIRRKDGDIVTLISVDTEFYKRFYENKSVKKTLTIPSWLNAEAEAANINFSQTLQKALKKELQYAE
jgi:predicted RNase H-like HicB family nuclease/post-segregation antitoxin (ccd killing protein)